MLLGMCLLGSAAASNVSITLNPSVLSPELLGTSVTWTTTVQGQQGHTYDYQYSVSLNGNNQIVRDFQLPNSFTWVPWTVEGNYTVTVVVRDVTSPPYIVYPPVSQPYTITPIVTQQGQSAVNTTSHPLVALFSAGPCTIGHQIRVVFQQNGAQNSFNTNAVPCSTTSENFLVAGMLPSTEYQMHWQEFATGFQNNGPNLNFTTESLPHDFPLDEQFTVNVPPSQHDEAFPIVLFQFIPDIGEIFQYWPAATDLNGNVLWYHPSEALITRMEPNGVYFTISNTSWAEWDLAGHQVLGTNPEIINEQLTAKGYPTLDCFNIHETRILPNGDFLLLGSRDEVSTMYQGGTQQNPVDILGDMILVLDHNMQLVWAWDSFAHENLAREATLDDLCYQGQAGCPSFNPAFSVANDWLHSNAVQYTSDGNILLSMRDQDWVQKINYANGSGDGSILWTMGPYGDFTILNPPTQYCGNPAVFPWFTHQHDPAFQASSIAYEVFTVFDDGNTRVEECGGGDSRGMILYVSEQARTVYIDLAADLGQYSFALGAAQQLTTPGNNYAAFGNGAIFQGVNNISQATETDMSGNIVYQLQANDWSYRIYRMPNLYSPVLP